PIVIFKLFPLGIYRFLAGANIFKIRKRVEEFSTNEVQIPISIKICKLRSGCSIHVDNLITCTQSPPIDIASVLIFEEVHITVQRPSCPFTLAIEGVVPAILCPIVYSNDNVLVAITIKVDVGVLEKTFLFRKIFFQ